MNILDKHQPDIDFEVQHYGLVSSTQNWLTFYKKSRPLPLSPLSPTLSSIQRNTNYNSSLFGVEKEKEKENRNDTKVILNPPKSSTLSNV